MTVSARRWIRWARLTALAAGVFPASLSAQLAPSPTTPTALAPAAVPSVAAPIDTKAMVAESLKRDERLLRQGATQEERNEAARRLIARQSPPADQIIVNVMTEKVAGAQTAIARALPDDPTPDPRLIPLLVGMLPNDATATLDAANALAAYKEPAQQAQAIQELINFERNTGQRQLRAAALHGLGAIPDKAAAAELITLVTQDRLPPDVRQAAGDALGEMTLLRQNGQDPVAWKAWWAENQPKSNEKFKADLLDRYSRQSAGPPADMEPLLQDLYRQVAGTPGLDPATLKRQRQAFLKRTLASSDASIRAAGVRLVRKFEFSDPDGLAPPLRDQLRNLVSDSAAEVRLEAATVLEQITDKASLPAILTQLAQEPDPTVRAGIADQVWRLGGDPTAGPDQRVIDQLVTLLQKDPNPSVAAAGARALGQMGQALKKDPVQAEQVMAILRAAMNNRGRQPANEVVRAACIDALAQLGDPSLGVQLPNLMKAPEKSAVRKAALNAMATMGDPTAANVIVGRLPEEKDDPDVRKAALDAIGRLSERGKSFALATTVYQQTEPRETDPQVREKAWEVFKRLLPFAEARQLEDFSNTRGISDNPERRLPVLIALAAKQSDDKLAFTEENIGSAYIHLTPPAPNDAAKYFKLALDYWRARNQQASVIIPLIREYLEALLLGRNYPAAVAFALDTITRDPTTTGSMASSLTTAVETLVHPRNDDAARASVPRPEDALRLIEAMQNFPPAQNPLYRKRLKDAEDDAKQMVRPAPTVR